MPGIQEQFGSYCVPLWQCVRSEITTQTESLQQKKPCRRGINACNSCFSLIGWEQYPTTARAGLESHRRPMGGEEGGCGGRVRGLAEWKSHLKYPLANDRKQGGKKNLGKRKISLLFQSGGTAGLWLSPSLPLYSIKQLNSCIYSICWLYQLFLFRPLPKFISAETHKAFTCMVVSVCH